ncbi:hypothetical protein JW905_17395 [bacterium]|nr:hypothetical protein [candidate division CSSED10-310 bacterium]
MTAADERPDLSAGTPLLIVFLTVLNTGNVPPVFPLLRILPGSFPCPFTHSGVANPLQQILTSAIIGLAILHVLVDCLLRAAPGASRWRRWFPTYGWSMTVTTILVLLTTVVPQLAHVSIRARTGNLSYTHDGGCLYMEEAARFIIEGRDPYVESYRGTSVAVKFAGDPFWRTQVHEHILDHNPYLPGPILMTVPAMLVMERLCGFYDQRLLYIPVLCLTLILFPLLFARCNRPAALALFALNPVVSMYLVQGTMDVLLFAALTAHLLLVRRGSFTGASLVLGLACVIKQFAWFMVPFHLVYCASLLAHTRLSWTGEWFRRAVIPLVIVGLCLVMPFLVSAPKSFIEDAVLFNFGLLGRSYPFGGTPGFGMANVLLALGVVPDTMHEFPMFLFQIPALVIGALCALLLWRRPSVRSLSSGFALSTLLFLYSSRMFHFSYLGVFTTFLLVAYLAEESPSRRARSRSDRYAGFPGA